MATKTQSPAAAAAAIALEPMKIVLRATAEIKPYEKNARKISPAAVMKVAKSIQEFGWRQPVVVDVHDVIIVGHARWMAAKHLGIEKIPVHVAEGLSEDQVKAYRLADNRTHEEAGWDMGLVGSELFELKAASFDILKTGFETQEIAFGVATHFGFDLESFSTKKTSRKRAGEAEAPDAGFEYRVVVTADNEQHQAELLERFKADGLKCKALIS